jgi:hypothetical protein
MPIGRRSMPRPDPPIGAISIGYLDEPPRELSSRRKLKTETVYRCTRPGK